VLAFFVQPTERTPEEFIRTATRLVNNAKEKDIILRVIGATSVLIHVGKDTPVLDVFKSYRKLTDVDFVTYRKCWPKIEDFFQEQEFQPNETFNALHGNKQLNFARPDGLHADVFCDKLDMSHVIDFTGRLEQDYPTIPLADLLLEKIQIVKINEKDIKDTLLLLRTHDIGDNDNDVINAPWIAHTLKDDWGFWYTVTTNLSKVNVQKNQYDWLSPEDRAIIESRISKLLGTIESEPKTSRWRFRARIGTRKKWYNEVEELSIT
jgi:hypothetical protein